MAENKKEVFTDWSQVPLVLKPKQLSKISNISSDIIYQLLKVDVEDGGIPSIKCGGGHRVHYLISRESFRNWLEAAAQEQRILGV